MNVLFVVLSVAEITHVKINLGTET